MALTAGAVRRATDLPLGIQVLAGANLAALDIALTCDLDFIRVEGFAYADVADEGIIEADARPLMRRRGESSLHPPLIGAGGVRSSPAPELSRTYCIFSQRTKKVL